MVTTGNAKFANQKQPNSQDEHPRLRLYKKSADRENMDREEQKGSRRKIRCFDHENGINGLVDALSPRK